MSRFRTAIDHVRLGAFPLAYGLSGALIGGTLNRVMIAELGVPASLVAFLFTIPLFISPVRVWFGYRSDGFPILGRRREPYMVIGAILIGGGVIAATAVAVNFHRSTAVLFGAELLAFLLYGLGRNLGHTTYQALVAERFSGTQRSRAITFYEVVTLLGAVAGAGWIGRALEHYEPGRLVTVAVAVGAAVVALALIAAPGQERRGAATESAAAQARGIPFPQVFREFVLADPQVRRLFLVVICTFIGTLAQDVLLEPYGALVLGMSVGETTRLTMYWGLGVLTSMLLSGALLLRWIGPLRLMRVGIAASAVVFAAVVLSGLLARPGAFKAIVYIMGLGTGLAGAGMLGSVIACTTPVRAGLLMGVWGVANMLGHALGSLMGGGIVDVVRAATGNALAAYSTVFVLEVAILLVALGLSFRLDFAASRAGREAAADAHG